MAVASPAHRQRAFNPWVVLTLVCMAQFMVILDATVVNVALPSIKRGLSFTDTDLQWIVNGYTLTFGGFLLLGGRAGDLFGRQRIFLAGLVIFSVASLVNGVAQSPTMLIIGRAVQGFGGALISPAALSIITTTFEEGPRRNKALGVWSAIAASGAAFGLLLGGVLTQTLSWRWVFFINVPIAAITIALSMRHGPGHPRARRPRRRRARRRARHRRPHVDRVRPRQGGVATGGVDGAGGAGLRRHRRGAAGRVRDDRDALPRPPGAAQHLPHPLAEHRQRGHAARRRRDVRDVLFRGPVRADRPRLLARSRPGWHSCRCASGSASAPAWPRRR